MISLGEWINGLGFAISSHIVETAHRPFRTNLKTDSKSSYSAVIINVCLNVWTSNSGSQLNLLRCKLPLLHKTSTPPSRMILQLLRELSKFKHLRDQSSWMFVNLLLDSLYYAHMSLQPGCRSFSTFIGKLQQCIQFSASATRASATDADPGNVAQTKSRGPIDTSRTSH